MDENTAAQSQGEVFVKPILPFHKVAASLCWLQCLQLGSVSPFLKQTVWVSGTMFWRELEEGSRMLMCELLELKQEEHQHKQEILSSSQKSPRAKYWLLLEDCYFYLMMWVSILEEDWPLKPLHNENHLFLLSKKTTAVAPCDCCSCPPSAEESSLMSAGSGP